MSDIERYRTFSRRAFLLCGGKVGLMCVLFGRLFYLQILRADRLSMLAEENRINIKFFQPSRGKILDRSKIPLAVNLDNYRLVYTPKKSLNAEKLFTDVHKLVFLSENERVKALKKTRRRKSIIVKEHLTWKDVAKIESHALSLPGISINVGKTRFYQKGKDAAHLTGYVGKPSPKDVQKDALLTLPEIKVGKYGLEKFFEEDLRGNFGRTEVEVNASGRVIRELSRNDGKKGKDLILTIDANLQEFVSQRLGSRSSAAVVMDAKTGDILAMASSPKFDTNSFVTGLSSKEWLSLRDNPKSPLSNKAISGQYSPGSTFKMVTALAALEKKVISTSERVFCSGHTTVGKTRFHCWKRSGHGYVNLHNALMRSCDSYFYEVAGRVGIKEIAKMAEKLGLGQSFDVMSEEKKGLIPTKEWKKKKVKRNWTLGDTILTSIGQGYVLTTPLQLATMTARLANGKERIIPRLILNPSTPIPPTEPLDISEKHLRYVQRGMNAVTMSNDGTAHNSRIFVPGMEMGGKTGTAQVRKITMRERLAGVRRNEDLPWKWRDHALFVGYAPIKKPRYVVSVIVEHGGSGSKAAAPIARDILLKTQQIMKG
ncbi:MAG: penicillin-binding protein 2 [Alphaproteobacteria bacterium]